MKLHVVFDSFPGAEGGRFVEVERADTHASVRVGTWDDHPTSTGLVVLEVDLDSLVGLAARRTAGVIRDALEAADVVQIELTEHFVEDVLSEWLADQSAGYADRHTRGA